MQLQAAGLICVTNCYRTEISWRYGELSSEFAVYGSGTDRNGTVSERTSAICCNPPVFAVFVGTPRTAFVACMYRGADESLARPGKKQATATEDFDVHISYL